MKNKLCLMVLLALTPPAAFADAQEPSDQHHNHSQQDKHRHDGMNERGDHAMGFSHEKATHHFKLAANGGAIEVTANDPNDVTSQELIRTHLAHIARLFKEGDFDKPMLTHGEMPAGVQVMKRLKEEITYTFENIERGGRVRVATSNQEATKAIHEFLRYQIREHQTGDPLEVER